MPKPKDNNILVVYIRLAECCPGAFRRQTTALLWSLAFWEQHCSPLMLDLESISFSVYLSSLPWLWQLAKVKWWVCAKRGTRKQPYFFLLPPTAAPTRCLSTPRSDGGEMLLVCTKTSPPHTARGQGQPVSPPPVPAGLVRVSQASQALCAALGKAVCAGLVRIKGWLWVISEPVSDHWLG